MKIRITTLTIILSMIILSACGTRQEADSSEELTQFRSTVDAFCTSIAETDSKINSTDTSAEGFEQSLMADLNSLNSSFTDFAAVDFPEEYDYLEHLADEAADYMSQAVTGFAGVYTDDTLTPEQMQTEFDNATEYYNNAFKRIKVIISFLNGTTSEDASVSMQSGTLTDQEQADQ